MKNYETPAPITTVVDIPAGHVQFIAADRTDTTVEVLPADASKSRDVKAAEQTAVDYTDGVLRITTTAKNQLLGSSGSVEVTVQLPTGSHVQAKAASAELRGVGRLGEVTFDGAQAEVKLDETAGVRLTANAGDITIGRLNGSSEVSLDKGAITISEAVRGKVVLRTQAGDVSVGAAAGVSASLDAGTTYGRISNSLRNDGGAVDLAIHATTAYGDIAARSL